MTRRTTLLRRSAAPLAAGLVLAVALPLLPGSAAAQEAVPEPSAEPTASSSPFAEPTTAPSPPTPGPTTAPASPTPEPSSPASPSAAATVAPAPPPAPATLRLFGSAGQVLAGGSVSFTVTALAPDGSPLVGEAVDVLSRQGGTTSLVRVGRVTTGPVGQASFVWRPRVTAEYTLRRVFGPTAGTDRRVVHVQPRLTAAGSPPVVGLGGTAVLRGALAPAYAGARLQVQRRAADGSWRGVAVIGTSGTGAWSWSVRPGLPGRYVFRVALPAAPAHRGAASAGVAVEVLPLPAAGLRQGATGPAVSALERALLALKGDVGQLDGVFDGDLRHAVTAFQKTQGLPRTGRYDPATRARLASPMPVRLRYPAAGRAVEIDLVKQVLYLSEAGRLARVVDISSGNGQPYVVDGVTHHAITPVGRFRVTRKIDGIRISHLGELYRPAYFYRGWAIHGSPSVPPYPASHGCIRVTNSTQNRLFGLLTVGTPVAVYR